MATFFSDTFTDTAGTLLESHTPDTGTSWAKASPAPSSAVITASGRARIGGNTFGYYYANATPGSAEYDVTSDFYAATIVTDAGITGRNNTASQTMYRFRYRQGLTEWQLNKVVAGAVTNLATAGQTLTAGVTYALKLEIRDAAKKAYVDGVEVVSSTDNAITAADYAGLYLGGLTTADDTRGFQFDNYHVSDPPAAAEDRTPLGIYIPRISRKSIRHMGV